MTYEMLTQTKLEFMTSIHDVWAAESMPPVPQVLEQQVAQLYSEQLHWCSVCDLANENWMKKSQNLLVWFSKMVLA
jgi:flagellar biosynthesis chaperone FliJ